MQQKCSNRGILTVVNTRSLERNWLFLLALPAEGFEPPTYGLQNRCTTTVLSRHGASPRHFTVGRPCSGNPCAGVDLPRLGGRASNQVDPQHVCEFAAGVALCVPALLTVKLV